MEPLLLELAEVLKLTEFLELIRFSARYSRGAMETSEKRTLGFIFPLVCHLRGSWKVIFRKSSDGDALYSSKSDLPSRAFVITRFSARGMIDAGMYLDHLRMCADLFNHLEARLNCCKSMEEIHK